MCDLDADRIVERPARPMHPVQNALFQILAQRPVCDHIMPQARSVRRAVHALSPSMPRTSAVSAFSKSSIKICTRC